MIKSLLYSRLPNSISNYFSKGEKRSINAKKNIVYSFLIKGFNIIIGLLLVPLTINYIDKTQYGIWLTLSSIISWLSFFDIGLGNGLRNKFAEAVATGKYKLARIYVSTTYAILSIVIGFVLIVFLVINPFLNWANILNTSQNMASELSLLALIVFTFFCLQFILQLLNTVLTANQEPAKAALFNLFSNAISLIIIFILTKTTKGNILYLAVIFGFIPILILLLSSIWFYHKSYKAYAPSFFFIRFKYASKLTSVGLKFFIIQIAAIVLFQCNNIIISHLFGPQEVTSYNIAFKYFSTITMLSVIVMTPFWTAFTDAWHRNDYDWIKNIIIKLQKFWFINSCLTIILLVFSNFFYKLWVGDTINISLNVSIFMALNTIITTWNMIYVQFLNGIGKLQLQLYSGLLGTTLIIPLTLLLAKSFQISGIVLASCILGLINTSWTYIQYKKLINQKAKGIWNK